ncbi:lipocalin-like domain-containing protein [Halovulum sp. GXIMD14794]
MRAKVFTAMLLACVGGYAWPQGYAGLGTDAEGYGVVSPNRVFDFPRDHLPHPEFRIEWWYVTANLEAEDGTPMGLQWTLFRQAMSPPVTAAEDGWRSPQIWMGHAAITTPEDHRVAESFARGGIGQAGVEPAPFEAWIDDWSFRSTGGADPLDKMTLSARGEDFSYQLELTADGPLVLQGDAGYSVKSEAGQASHYYSQPFYEARGQLTIDGRQFEVTGNAWLDREWSSQPLTEEQTGWDWFSLHLPGGEKLMAYRLRSEDGSAYVPGTWIAADGTPTPLPDGAFEIEAVEITKVAGREIPTTWRLRLPERAVDLTLRALNPGSFMTTAFPYWEGPVRYSGSHEGVGYLEMTGY